MPATRDLRTLPVPGGVAVTALFPTFEQLLADRGPALLPVPSDDPARTRVLVGAM
ncbi:O-succinylbenzoic acid--CoA ligase, partial [Dietzia sp. B44]|nr:O-succinylbenzoic acid--CoA ligase [Dietzia sp. B44]